MTLDLKTAVAGVPAASPYRKLLPRLLHADEEVREKALSRVGDIDDRKIGKREALGLLRAAVGLTFPPHELEWHDTAHDLIFTLVKSPHPELVPIGRDAYPRLSDRAKCGVLAMFGACGTREAARAFIACVREHGWPRCYGRVFTELRKLARFADVLFPELIERAGPNLGGVTDVLIDGLASRRIDASRIKLEPIAPLVVKSLRAALTRAAKHQRAHGTLWRFGERYYETRQATGAWLDVAGYLRSPALAPLLRKGLAMRDPKLALFAAIATLRRKGRVPAPVIERIAASHETREMLFAKLEELDKLKLFPAAWRTWDAFAASHMVAWLLYPSELGHEPDEIEQMAVFKSGTRALHVFRFRDKATWYAGVAGPFVHRGAPRPLHGHLTFSRFDKWASATAEDHALAVLKTLKSWQAAR